MTSGNPPAGDALPGYEELVVPEQKELASWRKDRERTDAPWTGIALSGGGIRSATFCLGVLQGLANKDLLKHFDYMSTVSGGGFIGSSLRWWWYGQHDLKDEAGQPIHFGTRPDNFPYGTADPDPVRSGSSDSKAQNRILTFLRNHGYYLAPGNGINILSAIGVVLRAVLLNLLVWIPFTALLAWLAWQVRDDWLKPYLSWLPNDGSPLPISIIPARWLTGYTNPMNLKDVHMLPSMFALLLWLAWGLIAIFIFGSIIYSLQTWRARDVGLVGWRHGHFIRMLIGAALAVVAVALFFCTGDLTARSLPVALFLFGFAMLAKATIVLFGKKDMSQGYLLRRFFERMVGRWAKYAIILLVAGLVPVAFKLAFTTTSAPGITGIFTVALGVASGLWGHYQKLNKLAPGLGTKVFLPIGSALFLFGVVVLGYEIAMILVNPDIITASFADKHFTYGNLGSARTYVQLAIVASFSVAILTGLLVNTNHISLNRYYRDRLMEAYMPRAQAINDGEVARTPVAERLGLAKLWPASNSGPYPLINTNVVLVNETDRKYRVRGGDSYLLSPIYCGSTATGWYPTSDRASSAITLPSAMAASGAAANPNAGYVGTGPTRERLLSVVMTLLNIRLGYWIPNPANENYRGLMKPNHFMPSAAYALFKDGFKKDSDFLELSDGGHFDNLGVYELVRRKCPLIVVVDGEADKETSYSAFVSAQRRIEEDFHATIELIEGKGPELLIGKPDPDRYPSNALWAKQPYFIAKLHYKDGTEGAVVYMKAAMIEELSFKAKGYRGAHPDFPHETTADQFFEPEQFEAYRELGYRTAMCMSDGLPGLADALAGRKKIADLFPKPGGASKTSQSGKAAASSAPKTGKRTNRSASRRRPA